MSNKNISAKSGETWKYVALIVVIVTVIAIILSLLIRLDKSVNGDEGTSEQITEQTETLIHLKKGDMRTITIGEARGDRIYNLINGCFSVYTRRSNGQVVQSGIIMCDPLTARKKQKEGQDVYETYQFQGWPDTITFVSLGDDGILSKG